MFLVGQGQAAAQSTELAELDGVTIVVENLGQIEKGLGLNEEWIRAHTLALLQSKVPRLIVNQPSAEGTSLVDATFGVIDGKRTSGQYYGVLEVEAFRLVAVKKIEEMVWAPVWNGQYSLTGLPHKVTAEVKENLNLILTDFAAKWHQDNPLGEAKYKK